MWPHPLNSPTVGGGAERLMANAILNFHFDFLHPSLISNPPFLMFSRKNYRLICVAPSRVEPCTNQSARLIANRCLHQVRLPLEICWLKICKFCVILIQSMLRYYSRHYTIRKYVSTMNTTKRSCWQIEFLRKCSFAKSIGIHLFLWDPAPAFVQHIGKLNTPRASLACFVWNWNWQDI